MPAEIPQAARDRWCDVEGARVALFCGVEQIAEDPEHGALFSRLHQRGQVLGRGLGVLYVRFQGEGQLTSVPPSLCALPNETDSTGVDLAANGEGESGYPVASASLPRSGPGAGVQVEHRTR